MEAQSFWRCIVLSVLLHVMPWMAIMKGSVTIFFLISRRLIYEILHTPTFMTELRRMSRGYSLIHSRISGDHRGKHSPLSEFLCALHRDWGFGSRLLMDCGQHSGLVWFMQSFNQRDATCPMSSYLWLIWCTCRASTFILPGRLITRWPLNAGEFYREFQISLMTNVWIMTMTRTSRIRLTVELLNPNSGQTGLIWGSGISRRLILHNTKRVDSVLGR